MSSNNGSQASSKAPRLYNLFDMFIYVTTCVNYTGELILQDDARIENLRRRNTPGRHRLNNERHYSIETHTGNIKVNSYLRKRVELVNQRKSLALNRRASNYMLALLNAPPIDNPYLKYSSLLGSATLSSSRYDKCEDSGIYQPYKRIKLAKMIISFYFIAKLLLCFFMNHGRFSSNSSSSANQFFDVILCDIFIVFKHKKMLNIVAAAMVSSSSISRAIKFGRLILNSRLDLEKSREINAVHLILSYLNSLKSTTKYWSHLVRKSWFHTHKTSDLEREHCLMHNLMSLEHGLDLNSVDIMTKMYLINMISFDECYKEYFQENEEQSADQWIDDHARGENSRVTGPSEKYMSRKQVAFLAKPAHRCDQNEMAWMLSLLFVMYIGNFMTITIESSISFMMEMNAGSLDSHNITNIQSISLNRWFQLSLWSLISVLDIYDLYLFFACSLICSSRARYLKIQLKMIKERCFVLGEMASSLQQIEPFTSGRVHRYHDEKLERSLDSNSDKLKDKLMLFYCENKSTRHTDCISNNDCMIELDLLNENLSLLVDLILVVQRELDDVKNFFGLYLNIEICIKPPCIAYLIVSLLESEMNMELMFIAFVTNFCMSPIFVATATAAWVENEFKHVAWELDKIIVNGSSLINGANLRRIMAISGHLNDKSNRSFVLFGNFSLTLGSLMPLLAWISTGVLLFSRT